MGRLVQPIRINYIYTMEFEMFYQKKNLILLVFISLILGFFIKGFLSLQEKNNLNKDWPTVEISEPLTLRFHNSQLTQFDKITCYTLNLPLKPTGIPITSQDLTITIQNGNSSPIF